MRGDNIKIIIVDMKRSGIFMGGDVHIDILQSIYREKYHIDVVRSVMTSKFQKFDVFSNTVALIKALFLPIDRKFKELCRSAIVIAPNPYPFFVITALKISKSVRGYPVIYFHHLSLSLKFITRRGILRTLMNYFLHLSTLSICKVLAIPIFLDNPKTYNIKGMDIFKDEDAPDQSFESKNFDNKKNFDLCYIGRFEKHKGAIDIIKVTGLLKKSNVSVRVAIVGHVSERYKRKALKILEANNLNESFFFFGTVDNQTKLNILCSSKIYLHLSYEEGWGMSVMDAAYAGIPIVAYNLPAYSYLKGKYNSVRVGDIKEAASTIKNVISNYSDAISIAEEAKKLVSAYNYLDIAKYQIASYEEIIDKRAIRQ